MRRTYLPATVLFFLLTASLVLSQTDPAQTANASVTPTPQIAFSIEGEIGRALPRKIVYDPIHEQMAVVDAYNRLLLINAMDFSTRAVLHERGSYGDIAFSRDGRWLAVLYGLTVELWDTQTEQRVASLTREIGAAKTLIGPLDFSSDNAVLEIGRAHV